MSTCYVTPFNGSRLRHCFDLAFDVAILKNKCSTKADLPMTFRIEFRVTQVAIGVRICGAPLT